ncbi:MAG: hypothetical protein DRP15_01605, partial [Candidatus Aenigmatarchaeota archaeon]
TNCSGGPETNYVYTCRIVVPAVPDCDEGTFSISPNYINFTISFYNATERISKTIVTEFPEISIGSFTCGNDVCETDLGESSTSCCYDCGCPEGYYCDVKPDMPSICECKQPLKDSDLKVVSVNPSNFFTHTPPQKSIINVHILNKPMSLKVNDISCEFSCIHGDTSCTASCDITCEEQESSRDDVYNATCEITFTISNYDPRETYTLYPRISYDVEYMNRTEKINTILETNFPPITIGSHWCGDGKCDPDESSTSCCYDCGCPEGYFCDTENKDYPTMGDSCRENNVEIVFVKATETTFTDSYKHHFINATYVIRNKPRGFEIVPECVIGNGKIDCQAFCDEMQSSQDEYWFRCSMVVPPIDYSRSEFYDSYTKKLTIPGNYLNVTVVYNNGQSLLSKSKGTEVDDIVINVVYGCGYGLGYEYPGEKCEADLGENPDNCCIDCDCIYKYGPRFFCYTGDNPNGQCMSVDTILLQIRGVDPEKPRCIIGRIGGDCKFAQPVNILARIINPPSDSSIVEAYITYKGNRTSVNCYQQSLGNYTCPYVPPAVKNSEEGQELMNLTLDITLGYTINQTKTTQNLTSSYSITVERKFSEAVESCQKAIERVERNIKRVEKTKMLTMAFGALFLAIAIGFLIAYIKSCIHGCNHRLLVIALAGFTAAATMFMMANNLDAQIAGLQAQKEAKEDMCSAESFEQLSDAVYAVQPVPMF